MAAMKIFKSIQKRYNFTKVMCKIVKYIIYSLYVFYCGASKTLNLSLQVEEIHRTFRAKNAPVTCSNRIRVQIILQFYSNNFIL
jgi:hypothetical protein